MTRDEFDALLPRQALRNIDVTLEGYEVDVINARNVIAELLLPTIDRLERENTELRAALAMRERVADETLQRVMQGNDYIVSGGWQKVNKS